MEEEAGGGHHHHGGQGPEGEPLPIFGGGHGGGSTRGRLSPPLSRWRRSAAGGTIAAVIIFINITFFITILISFKRSTLSHPVVIPYLNMVLYARYYDPMMCCHIMMF